MKYDGRGREECSFHSEIVTETVQSSGSLHIYTREEGAQHRGAEQPSAGHQSRFHLAQQRCVDGLCGSYIVS